MAAQAEDFVFQLLHALCKVAFGFGQRVGVQTYAVALHVGQHRHERHLDVVEQAVGAGLFYLVGQHALQAQGDVSILAGIFINLCGREVGHVFLLASLGADEFLNVDGLVVQVDFGQVVHVVAQLGLQHVVGQHRVEHRAGQTDAVSGQHVEVVLDVLADFQNFGVLVGWFKNLKNF